MLKSVKNSTITKYHRHIYGDFMTLNTLPPGRGMGRGFLLRGSFSLMEAIAFKYY